jgi:outer membrane protein OmpA-like peptidoglycan-associated protein
LFWRARIELAADVLFDFDKADRRPSTQKILYQAASIIQDKATGVVRIEGHTDSKGNDAYNQKLSEQRAAAVEIWLIDNSGLRALSSGFGEKKPAGPNTKPDGSNDPMDDREAGAWRL